MSNRQSQFITVISTDETVPRIIYKSSNEKGLEIYPVNKQDDSIYAQTAQIPNRPIKYYIRVDAFKAPYPVSNKSSINESKLRANQTGIKESSLVEVQSSVYVAYMDYLKTGSVKSYNQSRQNRV